MNTTNELLLQEQERLWKELKKALQNSHDERMYEELQRQAFELDKIKDTKQCVESYHDTANYMEQCNGNFYREGIGAYDGVENEFRDIKDRHVDTYEKSIQKVDGRDIDIAPESFTEEMSQAYDLGSFSEGNIRTETIKVKTVEQSQPIKASELLASKQEMQRELEKCAKLSAKTKTHIEIENQMPNGDKYTFEFHPIKKSNGMQSSRCTLKLNDRLIGSGQVKDVANKYTKSVTMRTQRIARQMAKQAAKVSRKVARKATKTAVKITVKTAKAIAQTASSGNPYSAVGCGCADMTEKLVKMYIKAAKKGIKIMKNEKILDMPER